MKLTELGIFITVLMNFFACKKGCCFPFNCFHFTDGVVTISLSACSNVSILSPPLSAGASSQTLVETSAEVKRSGETLLVTVAGSGFSIASSDMHWVRHPPGKGPEWVGSIGWNGKTSYNSAVQNRAHITRNTSQNKVYLQLSGLKPEDSAVYYCAKDTLREITSEMQHKNVQFRKKHVSLRHVLASSHESVTLQIIYRCISLVLVW